MRKVLYIVHGAHTLSSRRRWLQRIIFLTYKYLFNFQPHYPERHAWAPALAGSGVEVVDFTWSGKIVPYDIPQAVRQLTPLLQAHTGREVYFLTESIGTEIALRSIGQCPGVTIRQLIALCPVSRPRTMHAFPAVYLRSADDLFARFAHVVLWPLQCLHSTKGRVRYYNLSLRHDQFKPSQRVTIDGTTQTLLDFVKCCISNN